MRIRTIFGWPHFPVVYPVQQPPNDLLIALVRGVLKRCHAMFVQNVGAQRVLLVDFSQSVEIVDEYRFEHVPDRVVGGLLVSIQNHFCSIRQRVKRRRWFTAVETMYSTIYKTIQTFVRTRRNTRAEQNNLRTRTNYVNKSCTTAVWW